MKEHIGGIIVGAIMVLGLTVFGYLLHIQDEEYKQEKLQCVNSSKLYNDYYEKCESKYEVCLKKLRDTFSDLSDTWGVNTNNQDAISKTMQSEIDRCVKNI
jgi:hypothetical protein